MIKAIITMMDVPTALTLLAPRVQRLSRGGALLIFSCCLIILGPLAYLWWRFDLNATNDWFRWLLGAPVAEAAVIPLAPVADGGVALTDVRAAAVQAGADAATSGAILIVFGTSFTLLPSALQIGLARLVPVPGLGLLVKIALGFDLVTDWPGVWAVAVANPWFETTFRWAPLVGLFRLIATAVGCVLASVVVQSAVILVAAALVYLTAVILLGPTASSDRQQLQG